MISVSTRVFQSPRAVLLVLVPFLLATATAQAQTQDPSLTASTSPREGSPSRFQNSYLEAGGDYLNMNASYGSWSGGYMRGVLSTGTDVWNGEISGQHEFGDTGIYGAVGDTHTFNSDWFGSLSVGSSAGGFFWPRYRLDGFINRKALKRKQWVASAGFSYYAAKDAHRDRSFALGSVYYFYRPWVLESGVRFNISNPGGVFSPSGFVALTEGRNKQHYLIVRVGLGIEAYQIVGPAATLSDFQSQTLTVTWRKWVGKNWGFNLVGDYYHNPSYARAGGTFGVFKDF
jgi:YaiO family outer membrane protein